MKKLVAVIAFSILVLSMYSLAEADGIYHYALEGEGVLITDSNYSKVNITGEGEWSFHVFIDSSDSTGPPTLIRATGNLLSYNTIFENYNLSGVDGGQVLWGSDMSGVVLGAFVYRPESLGITWGWNSYTGEYPNIYPIDFYLGSRMNSDWWNFGYGEHSDWPINSNTKIAILGLHFYNGTPVPEPATLLLLGLGLIGLAGVRRKFQN